ncbi:hexitol phosphatase HxpB [Idiomarina loihiensis]|uniref:hexitol phosphatase HxpB n=1 Tax=Idiomarina loihiensis TaxID=135577 RepID=UPI002102AB82|nr:hexitol phosphatase HxpB [Idiomarina loihiensis]
MTSLAAIFDMDGLLIDSEPFWAKAERMVFSSMGVELSDSLCRQTAAMTTREVTEFWYRRFPWKRKSIEDVENDVIDCVDELIRRHGKPMPGAKQIVDSFHRRNYRVGLSTNSPYRLINTVLEKLDIAQCFHGISSSEHVERRKPDPAVYLSTLQKLKVKPEHCVAFEDSASGVKAAKAAGIKTIAVPPAYNFDNPDYSLADRKWRSLHEFTKETL